MKDGAASKTSGASRGSRGQQFLAGLTLAVLVAAVVFAVRQIVPDEYHLRMIAPEVAHRRELAEILAAHSETLGVHIHFVEPGTDYDEVNALLAGEADLAFAANEPQSPPAIGEVAQLSSEVLHVLVRPELLGNGIAGLRGRRVAMSPAGSDSRRVAEQALAFAGIDPSRDVVPEVFDESTGTETPSGMPDAVMVMTRPASPTLRRLVRESGFVPMGLPFAEAMHEERPAIRPASIPPGLYAAAPEVPVAKISTIATDMRLIARQDASEKAIRRLLDAVFDGAFAREGNIPLLDPENIDNANTFSLHPGTLAYLHRNDPLVTPDLLMETDDLRNLIGTAAIGAFLCVQWWQRRRSYALRSAECRVQRIEHEIVELDLHSDFSAARVGAARRELASVKADLLHQFSGSGRIMRKHAQELARRVDELRHELLALVAHHHQHSERQPGGKSSDDEEGRPNHTRSTRTREEPCPA